MIWIGLTGGMASGKSTVSEAFKKAGAFIVDADRIAHTLLLKEQPGYEPVLNAFGGRVLGPDGEIDRKRLGEIVFRFSEKRILLEQIIHPLVFEEADRERAAIISRFPRAITIFDAPLLIETKAHMRMDLVFLVYVDEAVQMMRLCQRDGFTKEEAMLRIQTQMPLKDKISFANEVIHNDKSPDETEKAVMEIYRNISASLRIDKARGC
jgi:dephospho-CoA kinase